MIIREKAFKGKNEEQEDLAQYFEQFREQTIGMNHEFTSVYGTQKLLYADWIASGRLYRPIEDIICHKIGPLMANTHSFSSESGKASTYAYHQARTIIKDHVNASSEDILITTGTGMTGALAKLQRILGLQKKNLTSDDKDSKAEERPVIFISHMEHHSNQVPWATLEADVVMLPPDEHLLVSPQALQHELEQYEHRKLKIGSFTACSNVTGIITPYHKLAEIMHAYHGLCFVDFAASAPYVRMDMHPDNEKQKLDAIFFSPHKFLGGPGTCGVLCFDRRLYNQAIPDNPGGGNVKWTNPWGEHGYYRDIETREDGGTPGILQVIRTALCLKLKEKMNPEKMHLREQQLLHLFYSKITEIPEIQLLGDSRSARIGCVSFNIKGMHYNLVVRLLNDRFGIQVRGGWSCASSYAHYLFDIQPQDSKVLMRNIESKDSSDKPGWVRVSLHPIMSDAEITFVTEAIKKIVYNGKEWSKAYQYHPATNEFDSLQSDRKLREDMSAVFDIA